MIFVKYFATFYFLFNFVSSERLKPGSEEWLLKYHQFIKLDGLSMKNANDEPIARNSVTFHLFANDAPKYVEITEENTDLIDRNIDKIFVLVHGWLEHRERPWYEDLKNAILDTYPNSYVIQVDYMEPAFDFYPNAVFAAKYVGQYLGEFLVAICEKRNISPSRIILIGHSLGSHVSGLAGKFVQNSLSNLGRIIALDPAAPPWEKLPCEKRLCESDADIVVGLHTDVGRYGYGPPIGTIDFYPNGGSKQKGCKPSKITNTASEDTMCDHWKSWAFMIEAVRNPTHFLARRCENWEMFQENVEKCDAVTANLGDFEIGATGKFYLSTNEQSPFAVENSKQKNEL